MSADDYDEFGFLEAVAAEEGLPWRGPPKVERREVALADGGTLSMLTWGEGTPELVFLHGGGQNAHTWDTLLLRLGRPALAIDLPGHGRSSWRADRDYSPVANAATLAAVLPELAPNARAVIGMSLGGATTIRLAGSYPRLVSRAVIIDVTPQTNLRVQPMAREDRGTVALVGGQQSWPSLEAMQDAAVALSPYRSAAGVRRGVRHNAHRLADGNWGWRYDLFGPAGSRPANDFPKLWEDVARIAAPAMLVLGGLSKFVAPEDVDEMRRHVPALRVETVPGAGHAVQSDRPALLAALIEDFVFDGLTETPR